MGKRFLLRYDTESPSPERMAGFFEKLIEVHRAERIPATFFCTGKAIENREESFREFYEETKADPLFDIQDHSYSHIGIGYRDGKSVEVLQADYERSFAAHERVFGARPTGVSICGTSGADGPRLKGFDQTQKAQAELRMLVGLGVRMINSLLKGVEERRQFTSYERLGLPDVMGFPSAYSDTSWMHRREHGDPLAYVFSRIEEHADASDHMPLMLHDWVAWDRAPDKELTHVKRITERARQRGYELVTHASCYNEVELWKRRGP